MCLKLLVRLSALVLHMTACVSWQHRWQLGLLSSQHAMQCRERVCKELGLSPDELELSMGMSGDYEQAVSCLQLYDCEHDV